MADLAPFQRVSVIIPAFNAEAELSNTLNSVFRQSLPVHQVIVVDDGSTDRTAEVARSHAGVTLIQQKNRGVSATRNAAIAAATGTWIALLDADDDWMPEKNQRQVELLEQHRDVAWSGCNADHMTATGARLPAMPEGVPMAMRSGVVRYFDSVVAGVPYVTSGVAIRRDVFERIGPFDERMQGPEDRDLFWRIAASFPHVAYVAETSCTYYLGTPNSLTKGSRERSQSLRMVCSNIRRDRASRSDDRAMLQYGRDLALYNYLARHAAGEIQLSADVAAEARGLVAPSPAEGLMLAGLRVLPSPLSRRLVRLVQPKFH